MAVLLAPMSFTATPAVAAPTAAAVAVAAPKPAKAAPKPTALRISGAGLSRPLTVTAAETPDLFAAVFDEVGWLQRATGQATAPAARKLGPKYTVVVLVNDKPAQTYDLYPSAAGGPRAYRPARQPDRRKTSAAWFYGRLTMSETLRHAGLPLPERPDVVSGGIGGGLRVNPPQVTDPQDDFDRLFGQLRQVLLLNVGVLLVITLGLAGMSLLIRRRV